MGCTMPRLAPADVVILCGTVLLLRDRGRQLAGARRRDREMMGRTDVLHQRRLAASSMAIGVQTPDRRD